MSVLRTVVFKTHKVEIQDIKDNYKNLNQSYKLTQDKLGVLEDSLPQMIRDMVLFYFE